MWLVNHVVNRIVSETVLIPFFIGKDSLMNDQPRS